MRRIVSDERVARFVADSVGREIFPPFTAAGVEVDGEIIGGVVFNCFSGTDIHVTVAGRPEAWTRPILRELGRYAFGQLGCCRATIVTEQAPVMNLVVRLGGQVEGVLRDHFGKGRPGVLMGILAEDWKF